MVIEPSAYIFSVDFQLRFDILVRFSFLDCLVSAFGSTYSHTYLRLPNARYADWRNCCNALIFRLLVFEFINLLCQIKRRGLKKEKKKENETNTTRDEETKRKSKKRNAFKMKNRKVDELSHYSFSFVSKRGFWCGWFWCVGRQLMFQVIGERAHAQQCLNKFHYSRHCPHYNFPTCLFIVSSIFLLFKNFYIFFPSSLKWRQCLITPQLNRCSMSSSRASTSSFVNRNNL